MNRNNIDPVTTIAIVNYENNSANLTEWIYHNKEILTMHKFIAVNPTADLLEGILQKKINCLPFGSMGGYHELARLISSNEIDLVIFFGNAENADELDSGINELLPLAAEKNIPVACNQSSADLILSAISNNHVNKHKLINVEGVAMVV